MIIEAKKKKKKKKKKKNSKKEESGKDQLLLYFIILSLIWLFRKMFVSSASNGNSKIHHYSHDYRSEKTKHPGSLLSIYQDLLKPTPFQLFTPHEYGNTKISFTLNSSFLDMTIQKNVSFMRICIIKRLIPKQLHH